MRKRGFKVRFAGYTEVNKVFEGLCVHLKGPAPTHWVREAC